jgi:hypothetical protein
MPVTTGQVAECTNPDPTLQAGKCEWKYFEGSKVITLQRCNCPAGKKCVAPALDKELADGTVILTDCK